jgi:hypothetical protein
MREGWRKGLISEDSLMKLMNLAKISIDYELQKLFEKGPLLSVKNFF